MVRFYDRERDFLREKWMLPHIQQLVNRPDRNGKIQAIANALCPLFQKAFTEPWPGESPARFAKRKRNMPRLKKAMAKRYPAETQEEFDERMENLSDVSRLAFTKAALTTTQIMYSWVSDELHTNAKRKASSSAPVVHIPVVPLPKIRKRSRNALDMYIKEAPRKTPSPTPGKFDVNDYRASCKDMFEGFTADQLAIYEAKARAFNEKFVRPANAQEATAEAPPAL